ncbi:MAG: glycosyltransferase family 4 protein [Microlunatus sp.]
MADGLRAHGVEVGYLGEWTRSHTLNLLLLPVQLAVGRLRGLEVVHLHWLYRFGLPIPWGKRFTRRLSRAWLEVVLGVSRLCGLRLVWTAHNVLPHGQIFDDDSLARTRLLQHCDAVIVHAAATIADIESRGWPLPPLTAVIPPASLVAAPTISRERARAELGLPPDACVVGLIGRIDRYKGAVDLIRAAIEAQPSVEQFSVVIAGRCSEQGLADELRQLANSGSVDVRLDLRALTDEEFDTHLAALDVFAVPFHRVTSSGSVATALAAGLTVLVPEHVSLGEIPDELLTHYRDLPAELRHQACRESTDSEDHRARAMAWAQSRGWDEVAAETAQLYRATHRQPKAAAS